MRWLLLILCLVLVGCTSTCARNTAQNIVDGVPVLPPPAVADTMDLAEARKAVVYYQAQVAALEHQAKAERMETHRRWLSYAMGLALLGALVCVGLAIFLPVGKKTLWMAAATCGGLVVAAYLLGEALAWLPLVGVLAVLLALGWLVWALWARLRASVKSGEVMQKHAMFGDWQEVKKDLIDIQGGVKSRVQQDIDKLAHKVREL